MNSVCVPKAVIAVKQTMHVIEVCVINFSSSRCGAVVIAGLVFGVSRIDINSMISHSLAQVGVSNKLSQLRNENENLLGVMRGHGNGDGITFLKLLNEPGDEWKENSRSIRTAMEEMVPAVYLLSVASHNLCELL